MNYQEQEITFFTVPDTGVKLPIRKVSPRLIQEVDKKLRATMPAPTPPMQTVNYGNRDQQEANPAHPDYLKAVDVWKEAFNQAMAEQTQRLLFKRGIMPFLNLSEEQEEQVATLRKEMKADFGIDLDPDDKLVFIEMIALGSVEDLTDITNELIRRSTATEGAIAEQLKKF